MHVVFGLFFFVWDLGLVREVENFSKHARISIKTALLIRAEAGDFASF